MNSIRKQVNSALKTRQEKVCNFSTCSKKQPKYVLENVRYVLTCIKFFGLASIAFYRPQQ